MSKGPIVEPPNELVEITCIYCKQGPTERNKTLFSIYAPGEYWQHWDTENNGCPENTENLNPFGEKKPRKIN